MTPSVNCNHCGGLVAAPSELSGMVVSCPYCQRPLLLPTSSTVPPPVVPPQRDGRVERSLRAARKKAEFGDGVQRSVESLVFGLFFAGVIATGMFAFIAGVYVIAYPALAFFVYHVTKSYTDAIENPSIRVLTGLGISIGITAIVAMGVASTTRF